MPDSAETPVVVRPRFVAPLDPGFQPAAMWNRAVVASAEMRGAVPLVMALQGEGGRVTRYESVMAAVPGVDDMRYAERLLKMLLWARGGWRVLVAGPAGVAEALAAAYAPGGARAFDAESMRKAYGRPLVVEGVALEAIPETHENVRPLGGHLDGCRIGFDLGASDFKLAAVEAGKWPAITFCESSGNRAFTLACDRKFCLRPASIRSHIQDCACCCLRCSNF
jgi:hypothetical protein